MKRQGVLYVLLLFFLGPSMGRGPPKESCGLVQNFMGNVEELFWDPIVNRVTFVVFPGSVDRVAELDGFPHIRGDESCASLGVTGGLGAIAVNAKLFVGIDLPFLFMSEKLAQTIQSFNVCNSTSSLHNLPPGYVAPNVCKVATMLARCALFETPSVALWMIGILVVFIAVVTGVGVLAVFLQ